MQASSRCAVGLSRHRSSLLQTVWLLPPVSDGLVRRLVGVWWNSEAELQKEVWFAISATAGHAPLAQLPPYPKNTKRPRYTTKTRPTPAAEVDEQTISGYEPQLKTEPDNQIDEEMQPGNRIRRRGDAARLQAATEQNRTD